MSDTKINLGDTTSTTTTRKHSLPSTQNSEIKKSGYLRKLKTMKKKYFVLKKENETEPARLEYYDSEKKWKMGNSPKRTIVLKTCFNINRKLDTKQKHAIALYTKDDCFTIILENEEELEEWLQSLLELQHGEEALARNEQPKPSFEHVWQVNIRNRGLASTKNILGPYHLCLTSQVLSLVKLNTDSHDVVDFPLMSIRRCGHSYCFFFMELGRSAVTGAGELWMQTEDVIIAQNMHEAILNAMRSRQKDDIVPRPRLRSCSTNESSKPISVHVRRQASVCGSNITPMVRERSDSVPTRSQSVCEGQNEICGRPKNLLHLDIPRPHSMFVQPFSSFTSSGSSLPSPGSGTNITDSPCSSYSIDDHEPIHMDSLSSHTFHSTTPENGAILLENSISEESPLFEDYLPMTPPDMNKSGFSKGNENEKCDDGYMDMTSPSGLPPTGLTTTVPRSRTPSSTTSPNLLGFGGHSNKASASPSQTDYLTMSSVANSPSESDGYMAMSPLGSSFTESRIKSPSFLKSHLSGSSPTSSSSLHHRKASVEEVVHEGYIPMAPVGSSNNSSKNQTEAGYIEMTSANHSAKTDDSYLAMSPVSSSVTSRTPSTDIRFSEFQLEKVQSYFAPSEEEEESLVRAYSIGSRISRSCNKQTNQLDVEVEPSRVRAFSVGSKVGIKFGKHTNNSDKSQNADNDPKGKKSSSAPLLGSLSNSWSGTGSAFTVQNSKTKINEDLMELDFAKSRNHSNSKTESVRKNENSFFDNGNQRGSICSLRPRSNSRSSCTRPSKAEMLQVIGEKSDLVNNGVKENVCSDSKRDQELVNTVTPFSTEFCKKYGHVVDLARNNDNSKISRAHEISSAENQDESDDNQNTKTSSVSQPLHIQVELPSSQKPKESPPSSGEYVNIDLSKQYQKETSKCLNHTFVSDSQGTKACSPEVNKIGSKNKHEYVNLQVGSLFTDKKPSVSEYSSLPRYKSLFAPNIEESVMSKSSSSVECALDSQKQTSASMASLPSSTRSPAIADGIRKTSSPATLSLTLSNKNTDRISNLVCTDEDQNQVNSASIKKNTNSSLEEKLVKPLGHPSRQDLHSHSVETLYENLRLGRSHSRPSSVSSDRELNYASLDLAPYSGEENIPHSPCSIRSCPSSSGEEINSEKLSYAKIDFTKSEGLRTTTNTVREIRH